MKKKLYDNYDYEEAYQKQIANLEEWELERLMKDGKVECLYRTTTTKSENIKSGTVLLEAQVYPSFKDKKDMPVTKKKRETRPSQKNLNDKNARRYLIRLANINFGKGDIWATFGWNDDCLPDSEERARKDIQNFIKRINRRRKKAGLENAKYIYILAMDGYKRPHFHILLPFYDRVVQHMIVNAIGPVFEERFYCHSYACREGKGMHAASNQLYKWLYELMVVQGLRIYAFKGDISKYFASIPHDGLKDENRRYIGDKKALYLMDNIIDRNGILPDGVGIPVGNLTSQLFANVYGNRLDKFIKHTLHIKYYVRYMDDFIILSPDLNQLKEWEKRIEEFLEEEMKLHINPKSTILYAGNGVDFCGYIHHPTYRKVRKGSVRRLKKDVKHLKAGELDRETFNRKYQSRLGHMGHADTYHVTKAIEYDLLFWEFEQTQSGLLVPV